MKIALSSFCFLLNWVLWRDFRYAWGSANSCPCVDAPKEFDHFIEGEDEDLLRTMCVVNSIKNVREDDVTTMKIFRYIEELSQGPQGPGLLRSERKAGSNAYKLRTDGVRLEMIAAYDENDVNTTCDGVVTLVPDTYLTADEKRSMRLKQYINCPGTCIPVPYTEIPVSIVEVWLKMDGWKLWPVSQQKYSGDLMVSCSLSLEVLSDSVQGLELSDEMLRLTEFLKVLMWRRIAECKERKHWKNSIVVNDMQASDTYKRTKKPYYDLKPRKIFSLVIWIGSTGRFSLMEDQARVLEGEQFDSYFRSLPSREYVVPFFSTEISYSCRPDSTRCTRSKGNADYKGYIPKSDINAMPSGWGCAQRRPLRTLAHVLLLFDPEFILMVDDDTFINYRLLLERYKEDIYGIMQQTPIVMGEFQGNEMQLTKKGIFAGGSGYFISKAAIRNLVRNATMYFDANKKYPLRSDEQIKFLSVGVEAFNNGKMSCAEDCIDFDPNLNPPTRVFPLNSTPKSDKTWKKESGLLPDGFMKISIRLVDLCTNLMAGENTCHHSDHSLGRCLVYGANVVPVGMVCNREYIPKNPNTTLPVEYRRGEHSVDYNTSKSHKDENGNFVSYVRVLEHYHKRPKLIRYTGMCFMSKICNTDEQLTCHRFKATFKNHRGLFPDKYYRHRSYYQTLSSCEVMEIDGPPVFIRYCA